MSDTPRTDAVMGEPADVLFAHACQLERELAAAKRELGEANDALMMKAQQCTAERLRANAAEDRLRRG